MLTLILHAIIWTVVSILIYRLYAAAAGHAPRSNTTVSLRSQVIYETERSFRFANNSVIERVPRSQVVWDAENEIIHMPLWLAWDRSYL